MIRWIALPAIAVASLACTASAGLHPGQSTKAEQELAKELEGRVPGKPVECISTGFSDGPQIIDSRTILYHPVGKTVYRNDLEADCPSLEPLTTMVIEVHGSQYCRNDRFRVVTPGMSIPSATCRLGKFTPYTKP
jgi:hypothetical protein